MLPLILFENVTVVRNGRMALDCVNLSIPIGENVAILGPNGSGKSTLVKAIAQDLRPYAGKGRVQIAGRDRWNLFDLRKTLGVVSNELQVTCAKEVSALDMVVSGFFGSYGVLEPYDVTEEMRDKASEVLCFLNAHHLSDRRMNELSSGEGRRVLIARALVNEPSALLLDEPTTSLDIRAADSLIATLRKIARHGTNLVLVTHHVEEIVPEIRRVILLKEGLVMLDGPTEQVITSQNLSDLYDTRISVGQHDDRFHAKLSIS